MDSYEKEVLDKLPIICYHKKYPCLESHEPVRFIPLFHEKISKAVLCQPCKPINAIEAPIVRNRDGPVNSNPRWLESCLTIQPYSNSESSKVAYRNFVECLRESVSRGHMPVSSRAPEKLREHLWILNNLASWREFKKMLIHMDPSGNLQGIAEKEFEKGEKRGQKMYTPGVIRSEIEGQDGRVCQNNSGVMGFFKSFFQELIP